MAGWHVTANDVKTWTATDKRRAEEILPLLVKKLILAFCKPKIIEFSSGDFVAVGGWDGILEVEEGNRFVPAGKSGWEFGTNEAVKGKADSDYAKRLKKPDPFTLEETTFVFVTSRLWTKRDSWVRSKQSTNKWKDVKGINAEGLQDWLEQCLAVHRWFAQLIGKRCADLWDAEQAWKEFACTSAVNLTPDFLLHERDEEQELLKGLLAGSPNIHRVKSRSKNEAYGFILAVIRSDEALSSRCLIVKNQASWDLMASSDQLLILIPKGFHPNGIGTAVANGHLVLLAVDEKDAKDASIILSHQPRLVRQAAIQKLGFEERVASQLYQDTKGYLEPLLRHHLMQPNDYTEPSWPHESSPDVLYAMFFATEWNEDNEGDKEVMASLSGLSYHDFEKNIIELSKVDDPPLRKIGAVWQVISKMDVWLLIASLIAKPYIHRFGNVVAQVITDTDPSYDLPSEERYMASIKGLVPKYSSRLKHGLADSMALLSVFGDEYAEQLGGDKPSIIVNWWVKQLFEKNNNTRFWYSISGFIELIAEAAPDAFLNAVEAGATGDESPLLGLFQAEGEGFFGGCYHSGLLWALELISWNKQYFARVSLCLARLSEVDLGGRTMSRPFNSLVDMYLGWVNNTSATHEERLQVLAKVLIPQYPKIAWRLMIAMLINNRRSTFGISKPEYREWSRDIERTTSIKAYFEYVGAIVDLLLLEVDKNVDERIGDLVDNFDSYKEDQQKAVIERMLALNVNVMECEARKKILKKVRSTLAHHREFPDAKWAWPGPLLDRLEEVHNHFDFDDVVEANVFLFDDHWPNLIDPIKRKEVDYEERVEMLSQKRISALEAVYAGRGIAGVEDLLAKCTFPRLLGSTAFKSALSEVMLQIALAWLGGDDKKGDFSDGFVSALAYEDFESAVKVLGKNGDWSAGKKARFLFGMPLSSETLKIADELPNEGRKAFWTNLNHYFVSGKDVDLASRIAMKLLENDRPLAAVDAVAQVFHGGDDTSELDSSLIAAILIRIATDPSDIEKISVQNVRYEILKAIEFLQDTGGLPQKDIRQIEWAYLKIFRFEEISPRYLMKSVSEDPSFFAQLVIWVSKRNDDGEDPKEDLAKGLVKQRAEIARELLDTVSILPGGKGEGIDEKALNEWVDIAREVLEDAGRLKIGDDRIGTYLSRCPIGKDGMWPHESVRAVIERVRSRELDEAIECGRLNSRGTTSRHPYAGGEQERVLSRKYYADAESIQLISPRTADILRSIAKSYEWDADRQDREVDLK